MTAPAIVLTLKAEGLQPARTVEVDALHLARTVTEHMKAPVGGIGSTISRALKEATGDGGLTTWSHAFVGLCEYVIANEEKA